MFPYDLQLAALTEATPLTIAEVVRLLQTIDAICVDGDGLKWFNRLYLQVTQTVEGLVDAKKFIDTAWLAELDVQFANLYIGALHAYLNGAKCADAWLALFSVRGDVRIARVQFAIAGINAHINRDLPAAIVTTCASRGTEPRHGTPQYTDYIALNGPISSLIDNEKRELNVRLLGDLLPPVSSLEDTIAAWGLIEARAQAWNHGEALWHLAGCPVHCVGLSGWIGWTHDIS